MLPPIIDLQILLKNDPRRPKCLYSLTKFLEASLTPLPRPKTPLAEGFPRPTRPGHGGIEHSPIRPCQSLRGRSKWLRGIPLAWPSVRVDIPMSVRGRGTAVDAWHGPNGPWP